MVGALNVARYFLVRADAEDGEDKEAVTNLKLQKLLYYAQGYYVAMHKAEQLFPEEIQAWAHGPVVPDVYHEYKDSGAGAIPVPDDFDTAEIPDKVVNFLDEVYAVIGQFSAWRLRDMTHEETPWRNAWAKGPNTEITVESLREYFKTQLT